MACSSFFSPSPPFFIDMYDLIVDFRMVSVNAISHSIWRKSKFIILWNIPTINGEQNNLCMIDIVWTWIWYQPYHHLFSYLCHFVLFHSHIVGKLHGHLSIILDYRTIESIVGWVSLRAGIIVRYLILLDSDALYIAN